MEKNGEFNPENETQAQKEVQKKVYKPMQKVKVADWGKSSGVGETHIISLGSHESTGANRGGDKFDKEV